MNDAGAATRENTILNQGLYGSPYSYVNAWYIKITVNIHKKI